MSSTGYQIVQLANGTFSVRSLAHAETFHPVIGPVAEAEALYVRQLQLPERFARNRDPEFVIWDVGLGAAANPAVVLQSLQSIPGRIRLASFDHTLEPLRFALRHLEALPYLAPLAVPLEKLAAGQTATFQHGQATVEWTVQVADFPGALHDSAAAGWPKPHAILFDAFSPAKNPAMWTEPLFARIHALLDPARPCALPTYSRSTMLRVSLLLAGFFVGAGHATGEKEETTIAANAVELLSEPLNRRWLERARNSRSAEPMREPVYRQAPLTPSTWEKLVRHPQFASIEPTPLKQD